MNSLDKLNTGGEYILEHVEQTLKDGERVQAESLLTCLGALAGYACQVYVRQAAAMPRSDTASYALMSVEAGGKTFLFGDALNRPLAESPSSIWTLISAALQMMGQRPPDLEEIFAHVSKTVGSGEFGVPRVAPAQPPSRLPLEYLSTLWPQLMPVAQRYCDKPMQLPMVFGIAIQRALEQTKDLIKPTLAARIAMECAVAMSKVVLNPAASPGGAPGNTAKPVLHIRPGRRKPADADAQHGKISPISALMSLPPGLRALTIVMLVIIGVVGASWRAQRREARQAEHAAQRLKQEVFEEAVRRLQQTAREDAARSAAAHARAGEQSTPPPEQTPVTSAP